MTDLMGVMAAVLLDFFSLMNKSIRIADIVGIDIEDIVQGNPIQQYMNKKKE